MGIFSLSYGGTEDPWYRAGNNLQQTFLASGLARSATLLYRIAAVVFVLFAVGHTFGFLSFRHMLFWAFLSWHLAGLAKSNPGAIAGLGWAFFAVQAVGVVFTLLY